MNTRPAYSPAVAMGALALCCVFWGYSFPVNKIGIDTVNGHIAGTNAPHIEVQIAAASSFMGWRFLLGAALFSILFFRPLFRSKKFEFRGGLTVAFFFSTGLLLQMTGILFTRPSISGFLTALVVVFTPLAQAFLLRRPVAAATWVAVALALFGAVVMTFQPEHAAAGQSAISHTPPFPLFGELLTLLSAIMFSGQLLTLDHYGKRIDTCHITLCMFVVTAILGIAVGAILSGGVLYGGGVWRAIAADYNFQWPLATVIVLSTLMAMHLMNTYQPSIAPATASVLYCLEPIFALLFAVLFKAEVLTLQTTIGGAIILGAVLLAVKQDAQATQPAAAA